MNAKVQIGLRPVERWKGELKSEDRVRSTDYGRKVGAWCRETVQRCKSAYGLCKGGKVEPEYRVRSTERERSPREAVEAARLARSANLTRCQRPESSLNYLTAKH